MARTWKQFTEDLLKSSPEEKEKFKQRIIHAYNFGPTEDLAFLRQKAQKGTLTKPEQIRLTALSKYF